MRTKVQVELFPAGVTLEAERGSELRELLAAHGMEFPCGGESGCGACRVRVIEGQAEETADDRLLFSPEELSQGWRLGCHLRAAAPMKLHIEQWSAPVLVDDAPLPGARRPGLGVAIDLGTTTVVAQLLDLSTGKLLGCRSGLNPQTAYGADVMSRVLYSLKSDALVALIRDGLGAMTKELAEGREQEIVEVVLAGNTVMHHLFCGLDIDPLAHVPFESPNKGEYRFRPAELGWDLPATAAVRFLPCIGGFVGSDVLAGIATVGLHRGRGLRALVDLGTNGEIALGDESGILCASTAAGTAFEAGSIQMGMRAATGAVAHVRVGEAGLEYSVIGDVEPRGICGSGLVDAVAALLDTGAILPNGRLANKAREASVAGPVKLVQADVRQLQLAKGAVAAGLRILLKHRGARMEDIETVYLSGAFGNYVSAPSAVRIGLLEVPASRILSAGNTSLRGAKLLMNSGYEPVLERLRHICLAADPEFQDTFAECLTFPEGVVGEASTLAVAGTREG